MENEKDVAQLCIMFLECMKNKIPDHYFTISMRKINRKTVDSVISMIEKIYT